MTKKPDTPPRRSVAQAIENIKKPTAAQEAADKAARDRADNTSYGSRGPKGPLPKISGKR